MRKKLAPREDGKVYNARGKVKEGQEGWELAGGGYKVGPGGRPCGCVGSQGERT